MKLFIKIIFYANFLFWGGGFLIAFCQFVVYNGFGNIFEYIPSEKSMVERNLDHMPRQLVYEYSVNGKMFTGSQVSIKHSYGSCLPNNVNSIKMSKNN
jgi:hypothetical protein